MRRPLHNTTALPRDLRNELGLRDRYGEKKRQRNAPVSRKDRRQAERTNNKLKRGQGPGKKSQRQFDVDDDQSDDDAGIDESMESEVTRQTKGKPTNPAEKKPKPILKKAPVEESESDRDEEEGEEEPHQRKISKTVQSKLDEDDAEIAALEKKLGMKKGRKLPKSFMDDGLGDLLGDLDDGSADESRKRKREADEWLLNKRRKAQGLQSDDESEGDGSDSEDADGLDGLDEDDMEDGSEEDMLGSDEDMDEAGGEFEGFDEEPSAPKKEKENPYVAPVAPSENRPAKYIPPSLRASSGSESESLTRLRRQAQGHLNKLSEANLISILAEFEKLYRDYPRQHVTSTIITLLMGLICERSALQDTFLILHAGFIAALYKIIGMDFGAEVVQKVVEAFDANGDERGEFEGKEQINLISLLSQLYNFHVVGSPLVFDYIRSFLQEITESNTELLLKIIRSMLPVAHALQNANHIRLRTPTSPR